MSRRRLVSMVGGTVTCALAIGFFMQRGDTASPRILLPQNVSPIQQSMLSPSGGMKDAGSLPETTLVLASATAQITRSASDDTLATSSANDLVTGSQEIPTIPVEPDMPRLGCDVVATTALGPIATVDLDVSAPCFGNQRLTIHHSGMMFTETTDADGNLMVSIPALKEQAVFIVSFGDGQGTVALAYVPQLAEFERIVVQWSGKAGFQIHAREFGAAYGEVGHVWAGASTGGQLVGGMITQLGNPATFEPQMAEVYTFPTASAPQSGTVALSVEAEVTSNNCGRDISAQSLELRGGSPLRTRYLTLSMPNCAALGDFLVLNNLVDDLKIASR